MTQTRVYKAHDGSVAAAAVTSGDISTEGAKTIGILSMMDNASAAGDIGAVVLRTFDGDKPQKLVSNIPLNSTYTLGPTLVGTVTQKLVVYNVEPFVECQYDVTNAAGGARNLEIYIYIYES